MDILSKTFLRIETTFILNKIYLSCKKKMGFIQQNNEKDIRVVQVHFFIFRKMYTYVFYLPYAHIDDTDIDTDI